MIGTRIHISTTIKYNSNTKIPINSLSNKEIILKFFFNNNSAQAEKFYKNSSLAYNHKKFYGMKNVSIYGNDFHFGFWILIG